LSLSHIQRAVFAVLGVVAYVGLAAPEFVRSAWLCGPGRPGPLLGYTCGGGIFPDWTHLALWAVGSPFYLLYVSSRVRTAVAVGAPFRSPRSASWGAGLLLILLALMMIYSSWPDRLMGRDQVDIVSCVALAVMAIYLAALLTLRTKADLPRSPHRAFRRLRWLVLISGLLFYAGIFAAEILHMRAMSAQCPQGSVCDMPAMGFYAFMVAIWLPGWLVFVPFLWSAADGGGTKPWPNPEPRIGAVLVGLLLLLWGLTILRPGAAATLAGLYYICSAGWFFLVQHLCGKAAKSEALEKSEARS
jgi:hypothetical protein